MAVSHRLERQNLALALLHRELAPRQKRAARAQPREVGRLSVGDHLIEGWLEAGLPLPSVVTGILRTVKRDMIDDALGMLGQADLAAVERNLRASLGL